VFLLIPGITTQTHALHLPEQKKQMKWTKKAKHKTLLFSFHHTSPLEIVCFNPGGHPKSPTCGRVKIPHPRVGRTEFYLVVFLF
jgi:hypothetical protein